MAGSETPRPETSVGRRTVPLSATVEDARRLFGSDWATVVARAFRWMVFARSFDARMQGLQRQGRIGFYGAATGQEAVNVAVGLLSRPEDWIAPGLREQLVALVRGHPVSSYVDHLFANARDPALGRNMPCHPTARDVHYLSMSSVIGTQITHAVGLGYALRLRRDPGVVFAFFGDGATSANDFHAGLNFAGVWGVPVVFCLTNNQWAISQPVERQSATATLAEKAAAYGIAGRRVDGTDFFAVAEALRAAIGLAREQKLPSLLEFVVYRMTPHSTSDDPTRYQPPEFLAAAAAHDPLERLGDWMRANGLAKAAEVETVRADCDSEIRRAIESAEAVPPPDPESLFRDVRSPLPKERSRSQEVS